MNRKTLINLVKLLFAAGLVWYIIHKTGWETIKTNLAHMDLSDWAMAFGVMVIAYLVSMVRWRMLMRSVGIDASFWDTLRLGFIGAFFNNVVPGLTGGDLIKAFYIAREHPGKRADAVLTVVVDRIVGIVALALIAAVIIPFDFSRYREAAVGIYGFLAAAGLGATVALSRRIKARLKSVLGLSADGRSEGRIGRALTKIDAAVSIYRHRLGVLFTALFLGVAVHLLIILSISILASAIAKGNIASIPPGTGDPAVIASYEHFGGMGLSVHCSTVPIIMIISALPIAPAGWGVGEFAFRYFYEAAGAPGDLAVALSFAYRLTATLLSLTGALFLLMDRKRVLEARHGADGDDPPEAAPPIS